MTILVCILVTVLAGSIINFYLSKSQEDVKVSLENQVVDLQKENDNYRKNFSASQNGVTKDNTSVKAYIDTNYGFSFNYPKTWAIESKLKDPSDDSENNWVVRLKDEKGNQYYLYYPSVVFSFTLGDHENITSKYGVEFTRYLGSSPGENPAKLYYAVTSNTLIEPKNDQQLAKESVLIFGRASFDQQLIDKLDAVLESFKF